MITQNGDFMINFKKILHQVSCLKDISFALATRHNADKMPHIGIKWMATVTIQNNVPYLCLQHGQ